MDALIGHTGFVGRNLASQREYTDKFNSKNFRDMAGRTFDRLVCAGVSAVKWQANKNPDEDWSRIRELMDVLRETKAKRFILISTIDVYANPADADESFDNHTTPNHAYGTHRLQFEDFCRNHFETCHVIRLPALFGVGLKKNVVYDLLNDNCLEMINPKSSFQYYDLNDLSDDIEKTTEAQIDLVNLFTEPIQTQLILDTFFPNKIVGASPSKEAHYELRTRHADVFGKSGNYVYTSNEVLAKLGSFIAGYNHA